MMSKQSNNCQNQISTYMIIGASSGIGREAAIRLARPGNRLVLVARRKEIIDGYSQDLDCDVISYKCDVSSIDSIRSLFDFLSERDIKLSGVLYSAGILDIRPIKYMEDGDIENMFRINTFGFYNICRFLYNNKYMYNGSSIVVLSSYASITKERGMSAYCASKAAVNALVEVLAKEFAKRSIRINAIMPGKTTSRMGSDIDEWSDDEMPERAKGQQLGLIPVTEVVDVIESLLSSKYCHFTGELITISGGYQPYR